VRLKYFPTAIGRIVADEMITDMQATMDIHDIISVLPWREADVMRRAVRQEYFESEQPILKDDDHERFHSYFQQMLMTVSKFARDAAAQGFVNQH